MNKRLLVYILAVFLTISAINIAWSARDMQAFRFENGVGFDTYQPKLSQYMAAHVVILIICLGIGVWHLKSDIFLPLLYAVSTAVIFYITHPDPFYKDWQEDCFFAVLGYVLAGVICFMIKDLILAVGRRVINAVKKR